MSRFALFVTTSEPAPPGEDGRVLFGPMLGRVPSRGATLKIYGDHDSATVRLAGTVRLRRDDGSVQVGILVSDEAGFELARPHALLHEEGAVICEGKLMLRDRIEHVATSARFELSGGDAFGFVRIEGRLGEAWILDEGPSKPLDLNTALRALRSPDGLHISRDELADRSTYESRVKKSPAPLPLPHWPSFPSLRQIEKRIGS